MQWWQIILTVVVAGAVGYVAIAGVAQRHTFTRQRVQRREQLDELTARIRYETRLFSEAATSTPHEDVPEIFRIGHAECAALFEQSRILPAWERNLLHRYAKRVYGKAIVATTRDVPLEYVGKLEAGPGGPFGSDIADLTPGSGDTGAKYDLQGRGLLTVFRLATGKPGEVWPDQHDVALTSARTVLTCSAKFLARKPWHVVWPIYRVRGLRLWKL
ncbi:hypothetical protein [Amycolatopsis minnesotensis]|uniref:Uncharacterized protein n=1 Tax=Amycolatopsis minnesotensis TaxID=337894 RepID=A0ABP5BDX3_9PSEU